MSSDTRSYSELVKEVASLRELERQLRARLLTLEQERESGEVWQRWLLATYEWCLQHHRLKKWWQQTPSEEEARQLGITAYRIAYHSYRGVGEAPRLVAREED